jgi:hypothetical protein
MEVHDPHYQAGRLIHPKEWIKGESFQALADLTYIQGKGLPDQRGSIVTIFVEMGDIHSFMKEASRSRSRFIVLSHNGDGRVMEPEKRKIDVSPLRRPSNIIAWFTTNLCSRGYGIFAIPLGLENSKWFPEQKKLEKLELFQKKERSSQGLLYLNFNKYNNLPQREGLYEKFSEHRWATIFDGKNGRDFESYLSSMISHDFVLSPEGNGPDTHRTWEALYLGTSPVLKKHILHKEWKYDLPIVWVEDWSEVTETFLLEKKKEMESRHYHWNTLQISHWKKRIQGIRDQSTIRRIISFGWREAERVIRRRWDKSYFGRRE